MEYDPVSSLEASSITRKCFNPSHFTRYLERTPVGTSTPFFILKPEEDLDDDEEDAGERPEENKVSVATYLGDDLISCPFLYHFSSTQTPQVRDAVHEGDLLVLIRPGLLQDLPHVHLGGVVLLFGLPGGAVTRGSGLHQLKDGHGTSCSVNTERRGKRRQSSAGAYAVTGTARAAVVLRLT
ncbi:hypothetical protein EYF80_026613 [Liparis tanakae]|uniref:Uncharacterized protein n=1 Tax=Liparis tanakae TaxID=230148 RepID=A0A4Z2HBF5_9TELE|nr:hypothetical protein EYF80_026613 [Liparis tanakae]